MTTKPEWERLADALDVCEISAAGMSHAAAELRRLGEENETLRETAKAYAELAAVLRDQKHYAGPYTGIARQMLIELDASRVIISNCVKAMNKDEACMAAATHLVHQLHQAKGRYHTQNALCALFDAFGLSNTKPERKTK